MEEEERSGESIGGRSGTCKKSSSSYGGSWKTNYSEDRFSVKEVNKLRNMVLDKEKEERRNNIVIKGANPGEDVKGWLQRFLKEALEIDVSVGQVRRSGRVIIVKLGNEEKKREIMQKKSKLSGGNIFIENDLTWEERKTQGEIIAWAKQQRANGKRVKIGFGKVRLNEE